MMTATTTINLLPWREKRRQQRQQEFLAILGVAAVLGLLVFWIWSQSVGGQIETQIQRNNYIEAELNKLESEIKEIEELETRRDELVARMKVIQDLQNNRPSIVYFFDQLVRTLPDGVYYTSIERAGGTFTINGVAESNQSISNLMRALEESAWFQQPNLQKVTVLEEGGETNSFVLTVRQELATQSDEDGGDKKKQGGRQ